MKLRSRDVTTGKNRQSLKNWIANSNYKVIDLEEQDYIGKGDLFPLVPKDRSPLRRLFEKSSLFRLSRFWRKSPEIDPLPEHVIRGIHFYSDKRIDLFVNLTITLAGLVMLIVPIWILAYTHPKTAKLAIITVFVLFFLFLVSCFTNAKQYESLGATAA